MLAFDSPITSLSRYFFSDNCLYLSPLSLSLSVSLSHTFSLYLSLSLSLSLTHSLSLSLSLSIILPLSLSAFLSLPFPLSLSLPPVISLSHIGFGHMLLVYTLVNGILKPHAHTHTHIGAYIVQPSLISKEHLAK